jgi:leucyl aminopeptidase
MKIVITDKKEAKGTQIVLDTKTKAVILENKKGEKILHLPCKDKEELSRRKWNILVRSIVQTAKRYECETITVEWKALAQTVKTGGRPERQAERLVENFFLAHYTFDRYKQKTKEHYHGIKTITIEVSPELLAEVKRGAKRGQIVGTWVNWCRTLANTPGNDMTPKIMVSEVRKAVWGKKVTFKVLGEKEMKTLGMGGVLAVGQGSKEESQFLILEYKGGKKTESPIVLVGKGVTFDTGGLDTKPHPHALDMMMDMSGGAAVMSTLLIAEELKLKKNLVALVPAVENMPSGESFRPGDVINMLDGTHVEIGHTDAEGRLILADAITYAKKWKPEVVLDVATLTGAAAVALGERATAIFTREDALAEKLVQAGEEVGDNGWRLPLWEEYEAEIAGHVGDISNIRTKGQGGVGGAITAATFLYHFGKVYPQFVHLDMAPVMTAVFDEELTKGAKGSPVRLLVTWLENL